LAQGLSNANKEYLSKLDAQLIVYQSKVQLSSASSQIGESVMNNIQRVAGVSEIGSIGLSSAIVTDPITNKDMNISIIGIEPGKLGMPPIVSGQTINVSKAYEAVVDNNFMMKTKVKIGDTFTIRSLQGKDYKDYSVKVIGITTGQQYLFRPSVFLPYLTWDQIRSKPAARSDKSEYTANIVAVKVDTGLQPDQVAARIQSQVDNVEVVNLDTAIKAIPGYLVQQQTLNTMQIFTLLIGVLVIGGFFQIQMLQKIPLIGVLKAIGTSNLIVAVAVVTQIIIISTFGVALGGVITLLLSLGIPATVPIVFAGNSVVIALLSLLAIGPLGGLVTVQRAVAVEPLTALGLSV
jgi:putative ABC transport system permease protein